VSDGLHENLDRDEEESGPTERSFGLAIGGALALIGVVKLYTTWPDISWRSGLWLAASAVFVGLATLWPGLLRPLNRWWFRLGGLMFRVVRPVIMALVFFGSVLPIGLLLRAIGKNLLHLHRDGSAQTYWIPRDGRDAHGTMKDQF
jgi:hypothetical protein